MITLLTAGKPQAKFWKVALVILIAVYLFNFFTPLRLTNDTIRYFRLVEEMLGTWNKPYINDFLPPGYVWALFLLAKTNCLNPLGIAILQAIYLAGSLYFLNRLFKLHQHFIWMAVLFLLSWNTIKFTLTPLSEMQFLFFSCGCLYFFHAFGETRKIWPLVLAIIFCALTICTRTAGMSLALALVLTPLIGKGKSLLAWASHNKWMASAIAVLILALLVFQMNQPGVQKYLSYYRVHDQQHPVFVLLTTAWWHIQEIGELFINIPQSKAVTVLPSVMTKTLYSITGLFFVILLIKALFSRKLLIPSVIRVYLVVYFLMVIGWPFFEVRFWFPVFPMMLLVLMMQVNKVAVSMKWRVCRSIYVGAYFVAGIFSLSYYTLLSYDRTAMADRHDAGLWRNQYRSHFFGEPLKSGMFENDAIYFLNKYDAGHKGSSVDQQFPERR